MRRFREVLIRYRLKQAEQSLRTAVNLLERSQYRASVVGAYSAMFYSLLALISTGSHRLDRYSGILTLFESDFIKTGRFSEDYADWLRDAFNLRLRLNLADSVTISEGRATQICRHAEIFVSQMRQTLPKSRS